MGCDGGTIPKRKELVRVKSKANNALETKEAERINKWKYCSLSQDELRRPIVACQFGRLYNKEAIIAALLEKTPIPGHLKSLKDVKELRMTANSGMLDEDGQSFRCPVTGQGISGNCKFLLSWRCGCVFSLKALQEVKMKIQKCFVCSTPFYENDLIVLNAEKEDLDQMKDNMAARESKTKRKKRSPMEDIENKKCRKQ